MNRLPTSANTSNPMIAMLRIWNLVISVRPRRLDRDLLARGAGATASPALERA